MSYITKYGSFWGMLPQTSGRIFWVAPGASYTVEGATYTATNDNDGLSPERAFRTVDYAVGQTTASVGDIIVLLPGSHSVSATITVDVAGITIVGIPGSNHLGASNRSSSGSSANRSQITSTETAGMIFTVTAVDIEIAHLHLAPITAGSGISVSSAAHRAYIHDNTFDLGATANTATMGVTMPVGVTAPNLGTLVRNCYFLAQGAVGPAVRAAQSTYGLKIENSTFELRGVTGAWAKAIQSTLVCLGTHIRDCDFMCPTLTTTVITNAIDTSGSTADGSCTVFRCYFSEGIDAIVATATGDVSLAESYMAGATGGVLRTSA
jgi:hypothetical protein